MYLFRLNNMPTFYTQLLTFTVCLRDGYHELWSNYLNLSFPVSNRLMTGALESFWSWVVVVEFECYPGSDFKGTASSSGGRQLSPV